MIVLESLLAGCGPVETGLQRDAARQLQERVLGVSEAAAASPRMKRVEQLGLHRKRVGTHKTRSASALVLTPGCGRVPQQIDVSGARVLSTNLDLYAWLF